MECAVGTPDSEARIADLSRKLIREADAAGVLPTPLDWLFEKAKITNIDDLPDESFLKTLTEQARGIFSRAKQKSRGIADLRERVTFVPRDPRSSARERFVKSHELAHQVLPWHNVDPAYLDCDQQLRPSVKATFEQEANFFGAETIFQGKNFQTHARDYQPNFDAVFKLADMHGASNQSTAWRFVEEQDEALALVQYYPGGAVDDHGNLVFNKLSVELLVSCFLNVVQIGGERHLVEVGVSPPARPSVSYCMTGTPGG